MSPSEAEGFFSSIGNFIKDKVAPVAVAALPAAATVAGTVIGGPVGAAAGNAVGKFAADNISKYGKVKPNQVVSAASGAVTSIASGNYQAAIPSVINLGKQVGNSLSPGAGDKISNIASKVATTVTGYAQQVNGQTNGTTSPYPVTATAPATATPQNPSQSQLLNFIQSTPFLQSLLSSIATGNLSTGLQLPKEDGSATNTSYVEMLGALKHLTENAIAEADNAGVYGNLNLESESEEEGYIEALIEDISNYENALLPNYDTVTY